MQCILDYTCNKYSLMPKLHQTHVRCVPATSTAAELIGFNSSQCVCTCVSLLRHSSQQIRRASIFAQCGAQRSHSTENSQVQNKMKHPVYFWNKIKNFEYWIRNNLDQKKISKAKTDLQLNPSTSLVGNSNPFWGLWLRLYRLHCIISPISCKFFNYRGTSSGSRF